MLEDLLQPSHIFLNLVIIAMVWGPVALVAWFIYRHFRRIQSKIAKDVDEIKAQLRGDPPSLPARGL